MPFQLNEAPQFVLNELDDHAFYRNTYKLLSILFYIPTLGCSIGWGTDDGDWSGCCWPNPISNESHAALKALIDALNSLKIVNVLDESISELHNVKIIEEQTLNTIRILRQVVNDAIIQGTYREIIIQILEYLDVRTKQETNLSKVIYNKVHITGYDNYHPLYE